MLCEPVIQISSFATASMISFTNHFTQSEPSFLTDFSDGIIIIEDTYIEKTTRIFK